MNELGVTVLMVLFMLFYDVERVFGDVVEQRVQPGANITLQCISETEVVTIEWNRNCTHVNQPPFSIVGIWAPPRFSVTISTNSSVLRIENITEGDLGLYYCMGTKTDVLQKREPIGKTFKVIFEETPLPSAPKSPSCSPTECGHCWILLFSLCPICILLTAFISSTCVYCLLRTKGSKKKDLYQGSTNREQSRKTDEDLCYASLDITSNRQKPRPKKKRQQNTDFSTYSEVRTGTK
ncbi:uncharacterized protein LOC121680960 [Alosa sapidissima]|uniref:uncharacterized protein LOC121680960 n=1 Tax=Alosa sapidissima TaxID=34773 RepID=UPI001C09B8D3|nr:uncharacterized protein LOC121680960 [Alosa sapidissima]